MEYHSVSQTNIEQCYKGGSGEMEGKYNLPLLNPPLPLMTSSLFSKYCSGQVNWDASKLPTQKNMYAELGCRMMTQKGFGTT